VLQLLKLKNTGLVRVIIAKQAIVLEITIIAGVEEL
jgi:hypothetical protein